MGEEKERKIPLFTVIKNGAILKNIFVINKPQEMEDEEDPHNQALETEEILIVGRHPDCNIMLTHPSISRFHLQIHTKPSSQKLSVLDLSSVHGTWVSGKKIDPGVVVELNEGDTLKVGGSTRIYKLHWIPMSRAYDMENPFLSAMDVHMEEEKMEENAEESHKGENTLSTENECSEGKNVLLVEGKEKEKTQSSVPAEDEELHSMDAVLEGMVLLFSDEISGVLMKKEIPSAPPMPENVNYSIYDDKAESALRNNLEERKLLGLQSELSSNISGELDLAVEEVISEPQNQKFGKDNESILPETVTETISEGENTERSLRKSELKPDHSENSVPSFLELDNYSATEIVEETENRRPLQESQQKRDVSRFSTAPHLTESIISTLQEDDVLLNIKSQQLHKENQTPKLLSALKGKKENAAADQQSILMVKLDSTCSDGCKDCLSGKVEDAENQTLSQKDYESGNTSFYSALLPTESVNSSLPSGEVLCEITDDNECTEEGKYALLVEGKEKEKTQSSVPAEDEELHAMDVVLEAMVSLFSEEISGVLMKKEIPSAPPRNYSIYDDRAGSISMNNLEERKLLGLQSELPTNISGELNLAVEGVISEPQNQKFGKDNESILPETVTEAISEGKNPKRSLRKSELKPDHSENSFPSFLELDNYSATEIVDETENRRPLQESQQKRDVSRLSTAPHLTESINSTLQEEDVLLNIKSQQVHKENQTPKLLSALKGKKENAAADQQPILMVKLDSTCSDGSKDCLSGKVEDAENLSQKDYESGNTSFYSALLPTESVNSSLPIGKVLSEVMDGKRNPTPQSLFAPAVLYEDESLDSSPLRLEKKSNLHSIWFRRGKPASVLQIQTGKSTGKAVEATNNAENKSISKSLFGSEEADEEIFTPDKENFTPNTLLMKALKRKGKLEEMKHSSKVTFSPDLQPEDNMLASDKENQTPKLIKDLKSARKASQNQPKIEPERMIIKGKVERVPFQSLLVNSACKSVSEALVPKTTAGSSNSNTFNSRTIEKKIAHPFSNKPVENGRRTWTMVADTTSLMDKESMKSLQLLQGLKGTRLIIPRMVIRELDCLKQRGSLFRRTTEASSVLEWIEDCMVKSKWWIHVQSIMEEGGPIAPTPPATPQSQFSEGSVGNPFGTTMSAPFSARGGLMEIASPTAEDHILDCALLFRKVKSDGQFVLLSNDVTLKIKAMTEGLICETVQEFRESLVNPFSERFMWADSSPRGQTWSVLDDVVLREKYNRCPLRKPTKGDVKGLKLILLHNSHYGQISSVR